MKKPSIIALLSDFGASDGFVASMKGKILSIAPDVRIVDISHSVEPQNVTQAAYLLWSTFRSFPKGTIFLSVVDPGVGTDRSLICAKLDNQIHLAPDNGLLKYVLGSTTSHDIRAISPKYISAGTSRTFHGRDILAPLAARLASGSLRQKQAGTLFEPATKEQKFVEIERDRHSEFIGSVIHIDHFGNIVSNFHLGAADLTVFELTAGRKKINKWVLNYAAASEDTCALRNSNDLIEVTCGNASAAKKLGVRTNTLLKLVVKG